MDLFSRRIVGWAMDDTLATSLVLQALEMAVAQRRPEAGLIHHSDRGSQYASHDYRAALATHQMQQSMSRKGNCYDNAPMESFFGTLKVERVYRKEYQTKAEARTDIFDFIERFYNRWRRHSTLDYQCPVAFEEAYQQQQQLTQRQQERTEQERADVP
jgi:putative transposase